MVDIPTISLAAGSIFGALVSAFLLSIVPFITLSIVNAIATKELSLKRAFIMAFLSFFVVRTMASMVSVPFVSSGLGSSIILPLIAWIILGEIFLKADWKKKLLITVTSFVVYLALLFVGFESYLLSLIPF